MEHCAETGSPVDSKKQIKIAVIINLFAIRCNDLMQKY
jgi:hypothetical protein